jgi:hypothetical protein
MGAKPAKEINGAESASIPSCPNMGNDRDRNPCISLDNLLLYR